MWTTSFSPSLKMKESLTVPMSCTCGRCIMFTCHGLTGTWRFSGNNGTTVARALLASPYQIFVQGRLQRQTQPLTAMAEIFGSDTAQQGAAAAVPVLNRQERVKVPANRFGPSRAQTRQVQDVDTLAGPIGSLAIDNVLAMPLYCSLVVSQLVSPCQLEEIPVDQTAHLLWRGE